MDTELLPIVPNSQGSDSTPVVADAATEQPPATEPARLGWSWPRICTTAGLIVLGVTPWASAQLPQPSLPAICPPLTAFANPTLFNLWFGLPVIRYPYQ